ncbi:hypothetical protein O3G_MSEX013961 [Manduca sexta]|uniref:Harmonin-binding protein USHBP1 PDZ-binding domain-containing protein n=1 Tax=Manduca sexta TaxID=7130 RepID=A0A922CYR6_MANSE|nr:hypothetical protein O3G_MSEX013961 [Manduca sexta]
MRSDILAGTRTQGVEPPRSTAYYYADLERIKRNDPPKTKPESQLSEYVESNEVINDGPVVEVPPLRDRVRQWSLPEYNTPENSRKAVEETYSTAGTFPMPEPKEKEPLLAELEVVGRLPLTQLETASGVRRSRSWYLCCPNMGDEEVSRESSWRYSSLRPVTAPPVPGQNGMSVVTTQSSGNDMVALRAERDALARALAAERQRAATAARAHDARLAELHGVIAELVRRRAADKHARAIPEEEVSDECESTTQLAGELDNDADRSRTEQNDSSSLVSPAELPTPQEPKVAPDLADNSTDTSSHDAAGPENPCVEVTSPQSQQDTENCDTSLNLSERDSEICLNTARCCQYARQAHGGSSGSCERQHGSPDARLYTPSPGRSESRQAKIASRVRLRKTEDSDSTNHVNNEGSWCAEAAERLALEVCAHADLREALVSAANDGCALSAQVCALRARCRRLRADRAVLACALDRAVDTAHRLSTCCAAHEASSVSLCLALRAADRALEAYDVLLALAETDQRHAQRASAELVARQLLARLDAEQVATIGEPLLSPGPWLQHDTQAGGAEGAEGARWSAESEARLRAHAARLKADTVALRDTQPPPHLFTYHDGSEEPLPEPTGAFSMAAMEDAVDMQEALCSLEALAQTRALHAAAQESPRGRRRRARHWLAPAAETEL